MSTSFYTHQHKNKVKTWLLMSIFIGIVVGLGYFLSYYFNSPSIFYIAIIASLGMNVWAYWFSHKTVIKMTGAKEVSYQDAPELHRIVENLAITAGLPKPKVYIVNDKSPNAFATGRNKEHAVVAVTTGLLEILDRSELEGVIAHELAHIGNNDMLISTVAVVLVGVVTMVSDMLLRGTMFGGRGGNREGGNPLALIIGLALAILMPLIGSMIRFAISRKREFLADATGAMLTRYPEGLASALEKIHTHGAKMRSANHATAHLFIANPFGLKRTATYVNRLFMTHPPADQRIHLLRSMDNNKK
ncbi:MAG: M48 family metalloprotease [Candidatus Pacebacteria bacterium]|nr:M48 family metalloprotease [Candidatus Paceibacterota bacterium]